MSRLTLGLWSSAIATLFSPLSRKDRRARQARRHRKKKEIRNLIARFKCQHDDCYLDQREACLVIEALERMGAEI